MNEDLLLLLRDYYKERPEQLKALELYAWEDQQELLEVLR